MNIQNYARVIGWTFAPEAPATNPPFDVNHKHGHVTRDGRKARYLGTVDSLDGKKRHVFAIRECVNGPECVQKVGEAGLVGTTIQPNDLFNAPAPNPIDTKPFWMVLADNSNYTNYRHPTETSAIAEARRLAATRPGVQFHVLQHVGTARDSGAGCSAEYKPADMIISFRN